MTYEEFLKSKIETAVESGFDIDVGLIDFLDGTQLKPHQRDIINWAIKGGRRAIFASFGLGKTIMQLTILKTIIEHKGGKALIVCPLGVKQEFTRDAMQKLGTALRYVTNQAECEAASESILITNYQRVRDGNIDPKYFTATSLDEGSVLRSDNSKTHHTFIKKFKGVKYKYVATACATPNDYIEFIFYAAFLEIMDKGQCKTRFFKRNSTQAGKLTLYEHREEEFRFWMASWAIFIRLPSDLGYDDTGYKLPELEIIPHVLPVDHSTAGKEKNGQYKLFRDAAIGLQDASTEKRDSMSARIDEAIRIIEAEPDKHFILWHHREKERAMLKKRIPLLSEVYGTLDIETREKRIIDFSEGRTQYLGSKPQVSGSGCNFQHHCSDAVYVGIDYKANDFIQSVYRIYRFLQKNKVRIHIILTESEQQIYDTLFKKWNNHKEMEESMISIMQKYGLYNISKQTSLLRKLGCERKEEKRSLYTAVMADSVIECQAIEENSQDLIVTSPPFSIQYEYSANYSDFGHNITNEKFFEQMDYVTPNFLRILKPGRMCCVHVKDRIIFGNFSGCGFSTLYRFSDKIADHFEKHGFYSCGRITICTDVVRENNATYRLGWQENCKDGTKMGVGVPEYVWLFRKPPTNNGKSYADMPVEKSMGEFLGYRCPNCQATVKKLKGVKYFTDQALPLFQCPKCKEKVEYIPIINYDVNNCCSRAKWQILADSLWRSSGNRLLTLDDFKNIPAEEIGKLFKEWSRKKIYDYEQHVKIAEELDKAGKLPYSFATMEPASTHADVWDDITRIRTLNTDQNKRELEQHICPLQFDVVDRLIERYSNQGELVFDPFAGLFTVPVRAIKLKRRGFGIELNPVSYNDGLFYCRQAEDEATTPDLFALDDYEQEKAE